MKSTHFKNYLFTLLLVLLASACQQLDKYEPSLDTRVKNATQLAPLMEKNKGIKYVAVDTVTGKGLIWYDADITDTTSVYVWLTKQHFVPEAVPQIESRANTEIDVHIIEEIEVSEEEQIEEEPELVQDTLNQVDSLQNNSL